jgi:hypothetical protein
MTFFTKKNLKKIGDEIVYINEDGEKTVVAEFKSNNSRANKFMAFIRANITVEKYFDELDSGVSPSNIARERGFY